MTRVIVAFTGLMGSGKTTAAKHLVEKYNYHLIKFAGPLKNMTYAFGLTEEHVEGSLKEESCDLLGGKSPRQFMQLLGTEFGRNMIDPDIWIKAWLHAVDQVPEGQPIVADDCRFPNEADAIYRIGDISRVARILRGETLAGGHVSELQAFPADYKITNNGTIEDFLQSIDNLNRRMQRMAKNG